MKIMKMKIMKMKNIFAMLIVAITIIGACYVGHRAIVVRRQYQAAINKEAQIIEEMGFEVTR